MKNANIGILRWIVLTLKIRIEHLKSDRHRVLARGGHLVHAFRRLAHGRDARAYIDGVM